MMRHSGAQPAARLISIVGRGSSVTRTAALYFVSLYRFLFPTRRLLQIIVVLGATVAMKWLSMGYDAGALLFLD
jgi:hypothetical protein